MKRIFYRISHEETNQGVWYDIKGNFTGYIHDRFSFCMNNTLKMDFDPTLVGYLSAADTPDILWKWFSKEDILKLQEHGWYIHAYESDDYWFYDRFQHYVINQSTLNMVKKFVLTEDKDHQIELIDYHTHYTVVNDPANEVGYMHHILGDD